MEIIHDDLLEAGRRGDVNVIVQQCNCLTVLPHGLSQDIATKFPAYGNIYATRTPTSPGKNLARPEDRPMPGTFVCCLPPPHSGDDPAIACIMGQWRPGSLAKQYTYPPPPASLGPETAEKRLQWFKQGFSAMIAYLTTQWSDNVLTVRIGVPYKIGCGLAGGKWVDYEAFLQETAKNLPPNMSMNMYQLDN